MSYILDALRRADAERRRGHAPALNDVAGLPALALQAARKSPGQRLVPWLMLALAAVAWLLITWWLLRPPGSTRPPALVAATPPAARPPEATPVPPPPRPTPPPLPPAPVVRAPPVVSPPTPSTPPAPPALAQAAGPTKAPPAAPVASPPAALPATARPIPASALPEPQRSAVARLALGGAVHSAERSQSFVLLGGQIVREGETLAPGIVLDRIAPRALVLRVGEQLVELPL